MEATPTTPATISWIFQTVTIFCTSFHRRALNANRKPYALPTQVPLSSGSGPSFPLGGFVYCISHFPLQVALLQVMGTPGVSEQDPEKLHQLKIK